MDTPFERMEPEARREWLDHPTTQAFLRTLTDHRRDVIDGLLDLVKTGLADPIKTAHKGGELRAYDFVIQLAVKE